MPPETTQLRLGQMLAGRYRLQRPLDSGGMARVYLATQRPFGRRVAIKVLRPEHQEEDTIIERFMQEARTVSRLSHPNTVKVFDFGRAEGGQFFLVMEYVEGTSLGDTLRASGSLPVDEAVTFAIQIAQALGEAHYKGIVHRDLKPDNVMVVRPPGTDPFVKVLDFGIAKLMGQELGWTDLGGIIGTPYYMAPEQARNEAVDARADVYALGCVLYEMVVGEPPYPHSSVVEVLMSHQEDPIPHLPDRLPEALDRFVQRALAKDPSDRQPDAATFIAELMVAFAEPSLSPQASGGGNLLTPTSGRRRGLLTPISGHPELRPPPASSSPREPMTPGQRERAGLAETLEPGDAYDAPRISPDTLRYSAPPAFLSASAPSASSASRPRPEAAIDGPPDTDDLIEVDESEYSLEEIELPATDELSDPAPSEPAANTPPVSTPRELERRAPTESLDPLDRAPAEAPPSRATAAAILAVVALVAASLGAVAVYALARSTPREVHVESDPPGALVRVDGVGVGRTPLDYHAPAGRRLELVVERDGYSPLSVPAYVVSADSDNRVFAELEPRVIDLTVEGPARSRVLVGGQELGELPGSGSRVFAVEWPEGALRVQIVPPSSAEHVETLPQQRLDESLTVSYPD